MIFYTLYGPTSKLEIHNDMLRLSRNPILAFFYRTDRLIEIKLNELSHFAIIEPKFIWGKIACASESGKKAEFRFTTNAVMMGKIAKYLNTLIAKNEKRKMIEVTSPFADDVKVEVVNNVLPFKPKAKKQKLIYSKKKIKNHRTA